MARFLVLVKETDKGLAAIKDSPNRAAQFKALATKQGVTVEAQLWTLGKYDGALILSAASEETLLALVLQLETQGFVRTCVCHAYDEAEFRALVGKM